MSKDKSPKEVEATVLGFQDGGNAAPEKGGTEKHNSEKAVDGIASMRPKEKE
jgi:hypothetical protein